MSDENSEEMNLDDNEVAVILAGIIFGAFLGLISNPQNPIAGILVGAAFFGALAGCILTERGREWLKEQGNTTQQQQQQSSGTDRKIKVCPECGWQNDAQNNYCNDCGTEL